MGFWPLQKLQVWICSHILKALAFKELHHFERERAVWKQSKASSAMATAHRNSQSLQSSCAFSFRSSSSLSSSRILTNSPSVSLCVVCKTFLVRVWRLIWWLMVVLCMKLVCSFRFTAMDLYPWWRWRRWRRRVGWNKLQVRLVYVLDLCFHMISYYIRYDKNI